MFFCANVKADLVISKDPASPFSDILVGDTTVTLGSFKMVATTDNYLVTEMKFSAVGGTAVNSYSLYDGSTVLSTLPGGVAAYFVGLSVPVPINTSKRLTVKANLSPIDGVSATNGTALSVGLSTPNAVKAYDSTGTQVLSGSQTAIGNSMALYKTKPCFTFNFNSPHGEIAPSLDTLLARFDVSADAHGDVNFQNANGNILTVNISGIQYPDGMPNIFTLKTISGTTLDSLSVPEGANSMTFDFSALGLDVGAGQTQPFYIYGDTRDYASIQLWLDDNNPNNVGWGIDGSGNYHEADKLFRGDIYGNALVNPTVTPEPSTIVLLITGLASLFLRRKK